MPIIRAALLRWRTHSGRTNLKVCSCIMAVGHVSGMTNNMTSNSGSSGMFRDYLQMFPRFTAFVYVKLLL
jgi:hypothetical protein